MTDTKKKMQAAWAVLLLLWGLAPAITSAGASGSGSGSSSPTSDPVTDPSEASNPENIAGPSDAPEGTPDAGGIPTDDPDVTGDGSPVPTGDDSTVYDDDPRQDDPTGWPGGEPLPEPVSHLPDPDEWRSWVPDPETLANKVLTGAAVQVSILAPTGIRHETLVDAGVLVAAGGLIAGDGPLPLGDAAAAGLVGPGFLLDNNISADLVPEIDVPQVEQYASILPDWEPTSTGETTTEEPETGTETVSGGETNDSTNTTDTEQTYTPDSGGTATTDPDTSTDYTAPTYDADDSTDTTTTETNDSTGTGGDTSYDPDSGGVAGWP